MLYRLIYTSGKFSEEIMRNKPYVFCQEKMKELKRQKNYAMGKFAIRPVLEVVAATTTLILMCSVVVALTTCQVWAIQKAENEAFTEYFTSQPMSVLP